MGKRTKRRKTFSVTLTYTLRETFEVEAADETEAVDQAWNETKWSPSADAISREVESVCEVGS